MEIVNKLQSAHLRFLNLYEPNLWTSLVNLFLWTFLWTFFGNLIFLGILNVTDDTDTDADKTDSDKPTTTSRLFCKSALKRRRIEKRI